MSHPYLAATLHDPEGRLADQFERALPVLSRTFAGFAINATSTAGEATVQKLAHAGAILRSNTPQEDSGPPRIGLSRRRAVSLALEAGAGWVFYCDFDRALHWAESHPQELAHTTAAVQDFDFCVLGRTPRAFVSHPRFQVDTETLINHIFFLASGRKWDVTAGARGISPRAAAALLEHSHDHGLSTDVSWPLTLAKLGEYSLGTLATEGLEYETADRYAQEVIQMGGLDSWRNHLDVDPVRWVHRLRLALEEAEAVLPFIQDERTGPLGPVSSARD